MEKKLFVFLLGVAPLAGHAEAISESQAEAAAVRFFAGDRTRLSRSTALPLNLVWKGLSRTSRSTAAGAPAFYVYNRGTDQGFVIVAGDDAVKPILAYSREGSFSVENMPENLKGWMAQKEREMMEVRSMNLEATPEVEEAWGTLAAGIPVVHYHTVEWDQEKPYNTMLPGVEGWHSYVGCAVTATAIVMAHHQWPDCGEGVTASYYAAGLGQTIPSVELGHSYLWHKMPGICSPDEVPMDEQSDAVSILMRDVGYAMRANYGYSETGARLQNAASRLPKHMKYRREAFYADKNADKISDVVWTKLMKHELDHNRPVIYAGYNSSNTVGHAFVLEGYDNLDLFAVNWGWSGRSNGFFALNNLYPFEQGAGGGGYDYAEAPEAVLRVLPDKPDSDFEVFDCVVFTGTMYVDKGLNLQNPGAPLSPGSDVEITAGRFANYGTRAYTNALRLAVTDASGHVKHWLYTTAERNLDPGMGMMPFEEQRDRITVTLPTEIAAGDRIRLLYEATDKSWKPVFCVEGDAPWEIVLKEGGLAQEEIAMRTSSANNLHGRAIATFSADYPTSPSNAGVEAFYAVAEDANTIVMKKINRKNGALAIPANVGVVLSSDGPAHFTMMPSSAECAEVPGANLLKPTGNAGAVVESGVNAYALAKRDNNILFHLLGTEDRKIPANRAYLDLNSSSINAACVGMVFDTEVTGIAGVQQHEDLLAPVYDLSGRRVEHPVSGGVYIKNGKKFVIR